MKNKTYRRNHYLLLIVNVALLSTVVFAGQSVFQRTPTASDILAEVRATFPQKPVQVIAELITKNKRGNIEQTRGLDFFLDLSAPTSFARYILSDAFGQELESLTITRSQQGIPVFDYRHGLSSNGVPLADPQASIEGLYFSWSDLCFDFLWWTNTVITGTEKKMNRPCYVLKVIPPDTENQLYPFSQLWIDKKTHGLLQADAYGKDNQLLKRMKVKNLKKVNNMWTLGDVEIHTYPSRHKTRLRIRDIEMTPE